jgi:acid phosphatase type 7
LVRRLDVARVLALGDLQYENGSEAGFLGSYARSWGTFRATTLPVPGNHEYNTAGAKGYYRYFGSVATPAPGYAATKVGRWTVYLLNSNCDAINCRRQRRWLDSALGADPSRCTAIVMHHPRYSSGFEHGSDDGLAAFWQIAYDHHVDLALAGHDHDYERFAPMDAHRRVRPRRGITSFVVGTGGRSLYHLGKREVGSRYFRADRFGVLLLRLGDGAFSWKFRTIGGATRDAGARNCR